jgi:2-iminobutanoate/2-iminopropanoate deaminase
MEPITRESFPELSVPLSMGVQSDNLVFVSGQGPLDLETGEIVGETVAEQTRVTLDHVVVVLAAAGLEPADVVNVTVYLTDPDYYEALNEVYAEYFDEPYPSRSCLVTDMVNADQRVEVEAIARK